MFYVLIRLNVDSVFCHQTSGVTLYSHSSPSSIHFLNTCASSSYLGLCIIVALLIIFKSWQFIMKFFFVSGPANQNSQFWLSWSQQYNLEILYRKYQIDSCTCWINITITSRFHTFFLQVPPFLSLFMPSPPSILF